MKEYYWYCTRLHCFSRFLPFKKRLTLPAARDIKILHSLDAGLEAKAIEAIRQWRQAAERLRRHHTIATSAISPKAIHWDVDNGPSNGFGWSCARMNSTRKRTVE